MHEIDSRKDWWWTAALAVAVVVAYRAAFTAGFVNWDDNRFVTANPLFAAGGWAYVKAAITSVQMEAYHPLHILSYLPDRLFWKDAPLGFHLVNLALFATVVALVYRLARRVASPAAAGLAALIYAVHPLAVESVMWISARKDLLATFFFLLALLRDDRREGARPSWAGLALYAAAILTKTSAACFPLVLVAWLVFVRRASWRTAVLRALPYLGIAIAAGGVTVMVWRQHAMILQSRPISALIDVPATYGIYAARVLAPRALGPVYPPLPAYAGAYALAFFVLAALVLWHFRTGWPAYALAAFGSAILPVSNAIPIYYRFADRYALLALTVLVPALALALARAPRKLVLAGGGPAALVLFLLTGAQAGTWKNSTALWRHAVAAQPAALHGHLKLAETERDAQEWTRSVEQCQAIVRVEPDEALGYACLFYTYAARAEESAQIPAGAARAWLAQLGPAMADRGAMADLLARVSSSVCTPCKSTLTLLGLRRWPVDDAGLLALAQQALDAGHADEALIYLSAAHDTGSDRYRELRTAAERGFEKR